jgi:hypothetical protein
MDEKKQHSEHGKKSLVYQCPQKCEENKTFNHPGYCPVCNMKLVLVKDINEHGFHHFFG